MSDAQRWRAAGVATFVVAGILLVSTGRSAGHEILERKPFGAELTADEEAIRYMVRRTISRSEVTR